MEGELTQDDKRRQVFDLLHKQSHLTNVEIALQVGVSESTVRRWKADPRRHNPGYIEGEAHDPRVLLFDIETSPLVGYTWGTYQTNVIEVTQDWRVLSFAAKWAGDKDTLVLGQCDDPNWSERTGPYLHDDDRWLCERLWELLDEADVVIAHNGNSFDVKKMNARFLVHRLGPPSPYKTVDTLRVARSQFKLTSNRLDDLGELLGVGRKAPSGFAIWEGAMRGDPDAWKQMLRYNKQDVNLLERVYVELLPWVPNHPHLGLIAGKPGACRRCGSADVVSTDKHSYTDRRVRDVWKCRSCGGWLVTRKSRPKRSVDLV